MLLSNLIPNGERLPRWRVACILDLALGMTKKETARHLQVKRRYVSQVWQRHKNDIIQLAGVKKRLMADMAQRAGWVLLEKGFRWSMTRTNTEVEAYTPNQALVLAKMAQEMVYIAQKLEESMPDMAQSPGNRERLDVAGIKAALKEAKDVGIQDH